MQTEQLPTPAATVTCSYVSPISVPDRAARAHEQMNALSVISSVANLLAPALSERDRQRMERLHRAVNRLAELIRDDLIEAYGSASSSVIEVVELRNQE
jgi:hypothetical protein